MLEVKEKISSYCKTPLPGEGKAICLEAILIVSKLLSGITFLGAIVSLVSGGNYNSAVAFIILTFFGTFGITVLSLKAFKKTLNNFYPENEIEAKELLIQIINSPKIFKVFFPQELKRVIDFIDKKQLNLKDLLTIKEICEEVMLRLEKETKQCQEGEKIKQTVLNYTSDNKNAQILVEHLSLCADATYTAALSETKEKKLYALK